MEDEEGAGKVSLSVRDGGGGGRWRKDRAGTGGGCGAAVERGKKHVHVQPCE